MARNKSEKLTCIPITSCEVANRYATAWYLYNRLHGRTYSEYLNEWVTRTRLEYLRQGTYELSAELGCRGIYIPRKQVGDLCDAWMEANGFTADMVRELVSRWD